MAVEISRFDESVAPGVRATLALLKASERPDGADTAVNITVPVSPKLVNVTVDVEFAPARNICGAGAEALRAKSADIPKLNVSWCDNEPLEAVTVIA